MREYSIKQIKEILNDILKEQVFGIQAIGNHELNRHLVYCFISNNEKMIFKIYYKKHKRNKEVGALSMLKDLSIRCPHVYKVGQLKSGEEWAIMKYIGDYTLDEIILNKDLLDKHLCEIQKIFFQVGKNIAFIHKQMIKDGFYKIYENGYKKRYENYDKFMINKFEIYERWIRNKRYPEEDMKYIEEALGYVNKNIKDLMGICESSLIHNDIDGRNIIVNIVEGKIKFSGLIDFEQCCIDYAGRDLVFFYRRYFLNKEFQDKGFEEQFLRGYAEARRIPKYFEENLNLLLMIEGVRICSWTYGIFPDYYEEGINLLKLCLKKE
ncbi:phosphotransferase [Oceanirhabdus seepicola]|uniref:Phosphotransferase n=1 Tax=Oceanirhabdus seepicola TaxID=2828781 RepID=A0A9J6NZV6_9CLOT|nr:phosphotransferase [Oceanirhabdus seepicola]MCM1989803.1 phosphotransferase [Oceanirhabdus seepicola]